MLIHQLSSGSWGKMNELEEEMENLKELMNSIKTIYKKILIFQEAKLAKF